MAGLQLQHYPVALRQGVQPALWIGSPGEAYNDAQGTVVAMWLLPAKPARVPRGRLPWMWQEDRRWHWEHLSIAHLPTHEEVIKQMFNRNTVGHLMNGHALPDAQRLADEAERRRFEGELLEQHQEYVNYGCQARLKMHEEYVTRNGVTPPE